MADPAFCGYAALQKAEKEREEEYFLPDARMERESRRGRGRAAWAGAIPEDPG